MFRFGTREIKGDVVNIGMPLDRGHVVRWPYHKYVHNLDSCIPVAGRWCSKEAKMVEKTRVGNT